MARVFVSRRLPGDAVDVLRRSVEVELWEGELPPPREVMLKEARRSDGLLTLVTDGIDAPLLDLAPGLRVVSNFAVGFDNIDIQAATARGVIVTNTPGVLTETTADFTWALLMAAARRVVEGDRFTREGRWKTWDPGLLLGADIYGATLGIVGLGQIGVEVARRATGFGMTILYYDVRRNEQAEREYGPTFVPLDELLARSDFVTLHVLLSPETHHLMNATAIAKMKRGAILVNAARGQVVDGAALYDALQSGQLAAAALDVTEIEPIAMEDPLLTVPNLIVTPHIASGSFATRARMATLAVENLLAALNGARPPNLVNPDVLGHTRGTQTRQI